MARKLLRNPSVDQWLDLCTGPAILRYLHVFNVDKLEGADIALAVRDTSITEIPAPANGSVVPTGDTGPRPYEYFVTAINGDGETEPLEVGSVENGPSELDDTNNYHTVSWDAVAGATSYAVYVRETHTLWKRKLVTSETSVVNDGSWNLAYSPPWLNMTTITCLLDYENLGVGGILQATFDAEITAGEKIVFATTNSMINLLARYLEVV
jgi:hypothetical protein